MQAYNALDRIAMEYQALADRYETLRARVWLAATPGEFERIYPDMDLRSVVDEMKQCVYAQVALFKDPQVRQLIETVRDQELPQLNEWQRGNYDKFIEAYAQLAFFIKNPDCIREYEEIMSDGEHVWSSKFSLFLHLRNHQSEGLSQRAGDIAFRQLAPTFQDVMDLRREVAQESAAVLSSLTGRAWKPSEAATALLNPGVRNEDIDGAFQKLESGFPAFIARIKARMAAEKESDMPLPLPPIPAEAQRLIFRRMLEAYLESIGTDRGRLAAQGVNLQSLAMTQTGFCWGYPDVQLSIETYEDNLTKGVVNAFHEFGHLLYLVRLGDLPAEAKGRPVGRFNGFGAHETAAMFMEQAGLRRKAFDLVAPIVREALAEAKSKGLLVADFNLDDPALSASNMYRTATRPDLDDPEWGSYELSLAPKMAVRVLMYRKLIDSNEAAPFTVADMPFFWAETMTRWTGVAHDPDDFMVTESHATEGLESYFWAYMTGGTCAAVLHDEAARKNLAPDSAASSLADYLKPYATILDERVFRHGGKEPPMRLLERALGCNPFDQKVMDTYMASLVAALPDDASQAARSTPASRSPSFKG